MAQYSESNHSSSVLESRHSELSLDIQETDEEVLKTVSKQLNFFARLLILCKHNLTEQIIFIKSERFLRKTSSQMQQGKTHIYSKFERKMLSDIRDCRLEGKDMKELKISDLKRTRETCKFWAMTEQYFDLVLEIMSTHSDFVCYLFMIISMMKNAGLISLVYPFFVFGYALMEDINPRKKVWYAIMIYTEALILVKFLYQLSFWEAIFWDTQIDNF